MEQEDIKAYTNDKGGIMIKHFCDVCSKEIQLDKPMEYTAEKSGVKYKVNFYATSQPGAKQIELCYECILKAIRS